jgi:hypothetical protein
MIEIPESANYRVRLIYVSISIYFDPILSHRDEVTGPYLLLFAQLTIPNV